MATHLDLPLTFTNIPGEPPLTYSELVAAADQYAAWVKGSRDAARAERRDRTIPVLATAPAYDWPRGPFADFLQNEPGVIMCRRYPRPAVDPRSQMVVDDMTDEDVLRASAVWLDHHSRALAARLRTMASREAARR